MESDGSKNVELNSVVRYDGTSPDSVRMEIQSPAKNRVKGTPVGSGKTGGLVLFERASGKWWNPKFDSDALEKEVQRHYFPHSLRRFQYALVFVVMACVAWSIFFGVIKRDNWVHFLVGAMTLAAVCACVLIVTMFKWYQNVYLPTSVFVSLALVSLLLATFSYDDPNITVVGTFAGSLEIMLLLYTFIPMPLVVSVVIGLTYSVVYEALVAYRYKEMRGANVVISKMLLHLCLHLLGIHIFIMSQVRHRSNFWKVAQSAFARHELQVEKQIKERMIHSLMPPSVAQAVMKERPKQAEKEEDDDLGDGRKKRSKSKRVKGEIIFRSFNMSQMSNVSILFADIVGFTKMSSNKTAEHLVGLLNDLFGRFDKLCTEARCEKISTLGDCYYCVAGCPQPQIDHAECCVKMGLGMITAIQEFDRDNNESVNMRVGVHTGTVLCGIVGTRRFKFDVWSNDVTLANIMESTGKPGMVHVSEASYELLRDKYDVEEGEDVPDMRTRKVLIEHYDPNKSSFTIKHEEDQKVIRTYFILGPKGGVQTPPVENLVPATLSNFVSLTMEAPDIANNVILEKKEDTTLVPEIATNHLERQSSVNGVSSAALLCRRHSTSFLEGGDSAHERLDEKGQRVSVPHETWSNSPPSVHQLTCPQQLETAGTSSNLASCTTISNQTTTTTSTYPLFPFSPIANTSPIPPAMVCLGNINAILLLQRTDDTLDSATVPFNESKLKQQARRDQNLIQFLNEDSKNFDFFNHPPINNCTLSFREEDLEENYRDHYLESQLFREESIASPRYHAFIEIILSLVIFILISICCFLVFAKSTVFIIVFIMCLVLELLVLTDVVTDVKLGMIKKQKCEGFQKYISSWWPRNLMGVLMAVLPAVTIYSNMSCPLAWDDLQQDRFFCFCIILSLVNFCNFSMISFWVKSTVATVVGVLLLIVISITYCGFAATDVSTNVSTSVNATHTSMSVNQDPLLRFEIILDVILLLLLIWFLNREFEISYRLSFLGSAQAEKETQQLQENKDQADWLLHNIIPEHVSDVVKRTSKYSKNHKDIGVIFATIVNFNEFYDEGFEGGREYLRVLNELVSDYEELLDQSCFKDVEKIKTISSSFMAASGLNEQSRKSNKHPYAHLFSLMDFAIELQEVVHRFNESIFNFNFVLNIGYNFGEVTAGVIGTTKLLYDIWGDTVNIASRMYSTGEPNRIQVPEATVKALSEMFEFEYRGEIYVKGKGEMKTYLLKCKRPGARWD